MPYSFSPAHAAFLLQSCSSKTDNPLLRKSSDRKEKRESIDMIVEFLDNSKLRQTIGSVDQELAKTVTSEGFSCKDVRVYLQTLSIQEVKLILEKCLKFIESETYISEPGNRNTLLAKVSVNSFFRNILCIPFCNTVLPKFV